MGMTTTEYKTHFSLWCIGKAPLLIGCDITKMSDDTKEILMNTEAIAVNQDKLGMQSTEKMSANGGKHNAYSASLEGNAVAVVLLNRETKSADIGVTWQQLGLDASQKYDIRDLWAHAQVAAAVSGSYNTTVDGHGVAFLKLTPT